MNIVVLFGGTSPERDISLRSGENVAASLRARGHQVETLDTADPNFVAKLLQLKPDCVFPALHGADVKTVRFRAFWACYVFPLLALMCEHR